MENNKYLNEDSYQQNAKKLKKTGKIVLIVGISMLVLGAILLLIGFIGFGTAGLNSVAESEFSSVQTNRGIIGGIGLFAIGGAMLFIAHRREIAAFTTQQVMPVAKEGINEIAPSIGNVAGEIAKGIAKGLDEAKNEK